MTKWMGLAWLSLTVACVLGMSVFAADAAAQGGAISEKTRDSQKLAGYFNLYWDAKAGRLWLEIDKWNAEFLYQSGLTAGVGSNDIGLDRGQLGATRIVQFERSGPKVLLIEENLNFRAVSNDADEKRAVRDSFAESVLWGFTAAAEENGHVLVDATDFYLRDAHGVVNALKRAKQGTFKLDGSRSAIYLGNTRNFPLNTEVEATLTFAGDEPGRWVRDVTPDPTAITVQDAGLRSAIEFFRHFIHGLRDAGERTDCEAFYRAAPLGEKRSGLRDERAGCADYLLFGPRRAGADSVGAARGSAVVEPGVRGGGIPGRVSSGTVARGRGHDGPALQRNPVGASRDTRLVLWHERG